MTRIAYFDLIGGASGDMILGALLDAGVDLQAVNEGLLTIPITGWSMTSHAVKRESISALYAQIDCAGRAAPADQQHCRGLREIKALIEESKIPPSVKSRAISVFERLAQAEAKVHGMNPESVHFHEVGAIDSIIDIVGCLYALHLLDVDMCYCSPITLGRSYAQSAHGYLPIPAPAVIELLAAVKAPLNKSVSGPERVTPTAAALIAELSVAFGEIPAMTLEMVGIGAGRREKNPDGSPNVFRCLIGQAQAEKNTSIRVLECNIDDQSPEQLAAVTQLLLERGSLDVFMTPTVMKKGRAAFILTVLCDKEKHALLEETLFRETTSFGLRYYDCQRTTLERCCQVVNTPYGPVRVKIGCYKGQQVTVAPEFEDCKKAALENHVQLKEVYHSAMYYQRRPPTDSFPSKGS
jgi:pyridinium-3,5-bisthiocarboxylic acid mononucleotide nickel chelatase